MNLYDPEETMTADSRSPNQSASSSLQRDARGRIRIIIADDHLVVTQGVRHVLSQAPTMEVIAEVHTISSLMAQLEKSPCDVLVSDYSFDEDPEPDGLRLIERIRRMYPDIKIVLLTMIDDQCLLRHVIQRGVSAFVSKNGQELRRLPEIITQAVQGKIHIDPKIASDALFNLLDTPHRSTTTRELSARELEVVRLYEEGMSVANIAIRMNRSRKTITTQKANAMRKLGVTTNQELIDAVRKLL
ncbi:response regulator transcription factor [Pandoraea sputorum]|uniref:response regulator transcription factor n=1 Tax=Pandoraea sputorum TaxID=93222 RepID=UPI002AF6C832|nr:response regulator transcription factor [Pandoraea sputorum]